VKRLENRPRLRIEVPVTVFQTEILTLTSDLEFQLLESYSRDPYTCKRLEPKVTRFRSSEFKRMDGWKQLHYLIC